MHPILRDIADLDKLPSPPQVALKIVEVSRDPAKGVTDLADVLRLDPAIASKVLQISNSASYSRGREVTTMTQAINVLGTKTVSVVALGFSLKDSMPSVPSGRVTEDVFWQHNVATAVACRAISRFLGKSFDETAFMCGLMSRIGQLILMSAQAEKYAAVLAAARQTLPTAAEERSLLGIAHHDVSKLLLEKWQLPETVCEVVEKWGDTNSISFAAEELRRLANIVRLADTIRNLLFDNGKATQLEFMRYVANYTFSITPEEIDRIFIACQSELQETLSVFSDRDSGNIDCESILAMAREQLIQVGLGLANDIVAVQQNCEDLERANDELLETSLTDALTGLPNRHSLNREFAALDRTSGRPYCVVMVDIDHFKGLNDKHGHPVGDQVLKMVGDAIRKGVRKTDFAARFGGEEFTVILPFCNPQEGADVAERLRQSIRGCELQVDDGTSLSVTVSAGVASTEHFQAGTKHEAILKAADQALYLAKDRGRDRCVIFTPSVHTPSTLPSSIAAPVGL